MSKVLYRGLKPVGGRPVPLKIPLGILSISGYNLNA